MSPAAVGHRDAPCSCSHPLAGWQAGRVSVRGRVAVALVLLCALLAAAVEWRLPPPATDLDDPPSGDLVVASGVGTYDVGAFTVQVRADGLLVTHPAAVAPVWETPVGSAFLGAAEGSPTYRDDLGLLRVRDELTTTWADQVVERVHATGSALVLSGRLSGENGEVAWRLRMTATAPQRLDLAVVLDAEDLPNRLYLAAGLTADETVHGFGAQSGSFDLRGRRLLLMSREQGVGRGQQPISLLADLSSAAAGGEDTTYLTSAVHATSRARSLAYRGDRIASVDLRPQDRMVWEVWDHRAAFSAVAASTPLEAVAVHSDWTGTADPPPAWAQEGLVVGMRGGTQEARGQIAALREAGVPLAAVWVEDWAGERRTGFGGRLQWNWSLDRQHYPGWSRLVADLASDGVRVLTYVNPFLAPDSGARSAAAGGRDLYAEADRAGFLVRDRDGETYLLDLGAFDAAMVDLSDPAARRWMVDVLVDEVAGVGASGWMADFAEGPPPDAVLDGGTGEEWRNRYAVAWQQVNAAALRRSGLGAEGLVWHRSGSTASAGDADSLWLGDQLQDWSEQDGLASVPALLHSLAASGMTQVHGDVGGYTALDVPLLPDVGRDAELMARWAEASLLMPVLRTHDGNRRDETAQPTTDPALAERLAATTRLFAALAPEKQRLAADPLGAGQFHPWFRYPIDGLIGTSADSESVLGPDLLLTPVLSAGAGEVDVTFPPGRWVHVWTGATYGEPDAVTSAEVSAPLGEPALFAREGSTVAGELAEFVAGRGTWGDSLRRAE